MKGWRYVLTYGYVLAVYARGDERRAIDRRTGQLVLSYKFSGGK